jgi:hypothetical protein
MTFRQTSSAHALTPRSHAVETSGVPADEVRAVSAQSLAPPIGRSGAPSRHRVLPEQDNRLRQPNPGHEPDHRAQGVIRCVTACVPECCEGSARFSGRQAAVGWRCDAGVKICLIDCAGRNFWTFCPEITPRSRKGARVGKLPTLRVSRRPLSPFLQLDDPA